LKIVDVSTGEILISKSINHKTTKVGAIGGTSILGVTAGGLFYKSKAMEDAVEKAIIEAVGIIVDQRSQLPPPGEFADVSLMTVSIANADFMQYNNLRKMLEGTQGVKVVGKQFTNNKAIYTLALELSADALAEKLMGYSAASIEITGLDDSKIDAVIK